MTIDFASFSIAGGRDHDNQDCVLEPVEHKHENWCAIADGVGGRQDGDRASQLAVETLRRQLERGKFSKKSLMAELQKQFELDDQRAGRKNPMATTLSVLRLNDQRAEVIHVGDTRIYHLRDKGIQRRTKDQTEVQDLLDRNIINQSQAARYPRRNVLNGFISADNDIEAMENEFEVKSGDRIILLTDGVYGVVPTQTIRNLSLESQTAEALAKNLKSAVEKAGVVDDYSALVLSIEQE